MRWTRKQQDYQRLLARLTHKLDAETMASELGETPDVLQQWERKEGFWGEVNRLAREGGRAGSGIGLGFAAAPGAQGRRGGDQTALLAPGAGVGRRGRDAAGAVQVRRRERQQRDGDGRHPG